MKTKQPVWNLVKASGKARREQEIALHGKQVSFQKNRVFESKKTYNRKNYRISL